MFVFVYFVIFTGGRDDGQSGTIFTPKIEISLSSPEQINSNADQINSVIYSFTL